MSKRRGFAYTSFALLSATILISIVFAQVYQPSDIQTANSERIGQASFFLESVFSDLDRSLEIGLRRSIVGANNFVVTEGDAMKEPKKNITEILFNGSINSNKVESVGNASIREWGSRVSRIAERSGYVLDITPVNSSLSSQHFELNAEIKVNAYLEDPTTRAVFNKTETASGSSSIEGVEDPMLTLRSSGRYISIIDKCGFTDPAEKLVEGSQNSSSVVYGEAAIEPNNGDLIENNSSRILVVNDVEDYDSSYTTEFKAVVSESSTSSPSDYNSDYTMNTGTIPDLENNEGMVLDRGDVWRVQLPEMFEEGCYLKSEEGPDILERLQNNLVGDGSEGIVTLFDVSELPSELQKSGSAVPFVYFNESGSYGELNRIKGVSDSYPWFRLDEYHVNRWGLESLVE